MCQLKFKKRNVEGSSSGKKNHFWKKRRKSSSDPINRTKRLKTAEIQDTHSHTQEKEVEHTSILKVQNTAVSAMKTTEEYTERHENGKKYQT